MVETGRDRDLLAEITAERHCLDTRIARVKRGKPVERLVA